MTWKKPLAWATGQSHAALSQKLEFVLEEIRAYRALLDRHSPHARLQDGECKVLAEKGESLGKSLGEVLSIVQPDTLHKWHGQRVANAWDFSHRRKGGTEQEPPAIAQVVQLLRAEIIRLALLSGRGNACALNRARFGLE